MDDDYLYKVMGERIRTLRKAGTRNRPRMTQAELAELAGLERSALTYIEKGQQKLPVHSLLRIAEVFSVSPWDLVPLRPPVGVNPGVGTVVETLRRDGRPLIAAAYIDCVAGEETGATNKS
jgi:transcriptional regulator with XRE-family HTH domain